jgi:hypothetical protein
MCAGIFSTVNGLLYLLSFYNVLLVLVRVLMVLYFVFLWYCILCSYGTVFCVYSFYLFVIIAKNRT